MHIKNCFMYCSFRNILEIVLIALVPWRGVKCVLVCVDVRFMYSRFFLVSLTRLPFVFFLLVCSHDFKLLSYSIDNMSLFNIQKIRRIEKHRIDRRTKNLFIMQKCLSCFKSIKKNNFNCWKLNWKLSSQANLISFQLWTDLAAQ